MNLLEFEGKRLFVEYGIPVPSGDILDVPNPPENLGLPAVVKAQVPTGGRGKAGGIRIVRDRAELDSALKEIIGMSIKGHKVRQVLIEECVKGEREFYLSIAVDRSRRRPLIMASSMGGVDIESVPDGDIFREWIDPWIGLHPFVGRNLIHALQLEGDLARQFTSILNGLWRLMQEMDAELVEINPLSVISGGKMIAIDSKVIIDDDSLFRHDGLSNYAGDVTSLEKKARNRGISFVQLDGDIGVIANGAGLTMATLDFLSMHGGRGGVFLDLGGTDDPQKVKEALLLMAEAKPAAVLINIFGGITKCDTVATGLLNAIGEGGLELPIIARIKGVNEKEAMELLRESEILPALSLDEATKAAVRLSSGA